MPRWATLAISCKDDVEVLISRLGDPRWYVIRNVVYVLGRIAHQGVERALDRALHHDDVRVRKEAVRALGRIESPTSRAYLISAFRAPQSAMAEPKNGFFSGWLRWIQRPLPRIGVIGH